MPARPRPSSDEPRIDQDAASNERQRGNHDHDRTLNGVLGHFDCVFRNMQIEHTTSFGRRMAGADLHLLDHILQITLRPPVCARKTATTIDIDLDQLH